MFYFTCNESKIYESFTFEISYKKKITFSPYSNFLRCTCISALLLEIISLCKGNLKPLLVIILIYICLYKCLNIIYWKHEKTMTISATFFSAVTSDSLLPNNMENVEQSKLRHGSSHPIQKYVHRLGLHDILHAICMRITSVKPAP